MSGNSNFLNTGVINLQNEEKFPPSNLSCEILIMYLSFGAVNLYRQISNLHLS